MLHLHHDVYMSASVIPLYLLWTHRVSMPYGHWHWDIASTVDPNRFRYVRIIHKIKILLTDYIQQCF